MPPAILAEGKPRDAEHTGNDTERLWRRSAQVAVIILAALGVIAALIAGRAVFVPIIAAVIIGSVIGPAMAGLSARGVPTWVAAVGIVVLFLTALYAAVVAVTGPLTDWIGRSDEIGDILKQRFQLIRPIVSQIAGFIDVIESIGRTDRPPIAVDVADATVLQNLMTLVTPAIGEMILFIGSLLFFLAGRVQIKRKFVQVMSERSSRLTALRIVSAIERRLGTYLVTATFINFGLGVATGLTAYALGLSSPVLWGVLAGVLNYLPYIGPAVMTLVLTVVGLISFPEILHGLAPAACFLVLTTIEGQFLMPMIVGRRVALNPFAVFLSMALWTWMWGPVGTFMAVPLLIAGAAVLKEVVATRKPQLPG
ncbi:AI-2E family transporter [Ancylobacter lacus]|uniref:AI-2E family transporter n=1 Tax=Ancylobacter lacus TaxID=2579970 RepID=UPI001BCD1F44|nr:AI-2E family transporter [Ancylobacter lacus]MBS7539986.1 AI-2E family transporter [Ancylobacter lacus]